MAVSRLKLLFDENFSRSQVEFVAKESRLAEMQHVASRGWSSMKDADWIPLSVTADFCLITGDRNERTRGFTVADLKTMKGKVILVGEFFDHMGRWDKARWLVGRIDALVRVAGGLTAGSVVLVDWRCKARSL